jgi:hypothetical protein
LRELFSKARRTAEEPLETEILPIRQPRTTLAFERE